MSSTSKWDNLDNEWTYFLEYTRRASSASDKATAAMRELYENGTSQRDIARRLGISNTAVYARLK